jgi:hypothetical protein
MFDESFFKDFIAHNVPMLKALLLLVSERPQLQQYIRFLAVSNALDSVKAQVDFTTSAARGEGVVELINEILKDDLQSRCRIQPEGAMATTSNRSS